jgi:hypothetical protein
MSGTETIRGSVHWTELAQHVPETDFYDYDEFCDYSDDKRTRH